MKYIQLYHYSSSSNLDFIDPQFYGTGAARGSECKRGKTGLNKIYFYTENKPEPCVQSLHLYKIYFPYEWKSLVYDRSVDPLNLYDLIKSDIKSREKRDAYEYELKDAVEQKIFDLGFKGWRSSASPQLPHVVVLFEKISTTKPAGNLLVSHWADEIPVEELNPQPIFSLRSSQGCRFFQQKQTDKPLQAVENTLFKV